ncbi:hypothetical protein EUA06_18310 [Nocardioides glacieisoli]|uniref:Uncharacterized protein n=1 Tax=Nocardioides glacieisoli TaxID=1168730 RepID=A0A4Q2RN71_9ACTN|nr:hypothetical protein [Nocardioides glacieisoli]RYB89055.1 hypothetical protein EUA06_18310 [Nocardioides glacieisoli]
MNSLTPSRPDPHPASSGGGALPETNAEPLKVHQALFGYQDGHRLLSSSTTLKGDTLATLARLTDGTSAESYAGFDGYLSGYPLPNGQYALSRTWQAKETPRPGAVWTHVLLIDAAALGSMHSAHDVIKLLRRPHGKPDLASYRSVVQIRSSGRDEAFAVTGDWRPILSALYDSDIGTVWKTADHIGEVESDVLALWWWQWPALRRQFSFCLGGSGRRTITGRDFDLLVVPTTRRLSAVADFGAPATTVTAAGTLIDADLHNQMPSSFRAYLRFCGAETQRRSAAGLLSDIWMAAEDPDGIPAGIQRRVADRVRELFPAPSNMRRLKRTVIAPDVRLPARWGLSDSAALLIQTRFGDCVRASDIAIDDLLFAVRDDPRLLLQAARSEAIVGARSEHALDPGDLPDPHESNRSASRGDSSGPRSLVPGAERPEVVDGPNSKEVTAAQALPEYARDALGRFAQPTWLEEIVALGGYTVAHVLFAVNPSEREAWARAFWALGVDEITDASAAYTSILRSRAGPEPRSLGWLAAFAANPANGAAWLTRTHTSRRTRTAGLTDLVHELTLFSRERRLTWRAVVRDAALIREVVEMAPFAPDPMPSALLLIADPASPAMTDAGLRPWMSLESKNLNPIEAAHLLRVAHHLNEGEVQLASRAFAEAWEACAHSDWAVWEALGDYPAQLGFGQDWDRARRISRRFAQVLRQAASAPVSGQDVIPNALHVVGELSSRAATQLSGELTALKEESRPKPRHEPLPPRSPKNPKKRSKGPIEQARQIASDWLGFGG